MNQEEMIRDVRKRLFEMQDTGYRDFHARLVPTVEKEKIIGIRTPILRKFAKEFGKTERSGNVPEGSFLISIMRKIISWPADRADQRL